jgi:hypothetical protein
MRVNKRSITSHHSLFLMVSFVFVLLKAQQSFAEQECCAACIGREVVEYYYDPLDFDGCKGGNRSCCFQGCTPSSSTPTLIKADFTEENPSTPQVKVGEWIQMIWPNMSRVTYEFYKQKQKKITTVRNGSLEAKVMEDYFLICPSFPGKIVARGWGKDSCTTATLEFYIDIVEGNINQEENCINSLPFLSPNDSSMIQNALNDENKPNCNPQGATIEKKENGDYYCQCTFEWAGEQCDQYPWWKIVATIGGAVAAVLSIAVSVKAFFHAKNNKKNKMNQDEEEGNSPDEDEDKDTGIYIQEQEEEIEHNKKNNKNKRKSFEEIEEKTFEMIKNNKCPGEHINDFHKQIEVTEKYKKKKSISNELTL